MGVIVWTLADVIVKLRKQKRWGRQKLSTQAKVSYATITRLETGREMKEASIRRVASAFNLTLAEIYALVPSVPAVDAETRELDRLWRAMPLRSRQTVLTVMRQYDAAPERDQSLTPLPTSGPAEKATESSRGTKRA